MTLKNDLNPDPSIESGPWCREHVWVSQHNFTPELTKTRKMPPEVIIHDSTLLNHESQIQSRHYRIIAVDGNPLKDIRVLQDKKNIKIVMKEGNIFVDRRSGREKYVVHDQDWGWKRI